MRLDRKALLSVLKVALMATEARATLPILECVKLEESAAGLNITATDLTIGVVLPVPILERFGTIDPRCVPARELYDNVRALPKSVKVVTLEVKDKDNITVNGVPIGTLPPDDFPPVVRKTGSLWPVPGLRRALDQVQCNISSDETRQYLNGAFVDLVNGNVAATDGHRLGVYHAWEPLAGGFMGILPSDAVDLILRADGLVEELEVADPTFLSMSIGDGFLTTRLIEGSFPHYQAVTPKQDERTRITLQKDEVLEFVTQVKAFKKKDRIPMTGFALVDGELLAYAHFDGKHLERKLSHFSEGDNVYFCINASYLQQAVDQLDGATVTIFVKDALCALLVQNYNDPLTQVVMPMRGDRHPSWRPTVKPEEVAA